MAQPRRCTYVDPRPVLREMERTMKSLDALKNDIEIIKREIQRYGLTNGSDGQKKSSKA